MKSKKLLLPTIILVVAVLVITACAVVNSVAIKPTIVEHEFPFSVTYELNGETKTIQDVFTVRYDGVGGYTNSRFYVGKIGDMAENDTVYILQENEEGTIYLYTNLYADYLMGDPEGEYYDDSASQPEISYCDSSNNEYSDEETLLAHGVKLIGWEQPTPIENDFVFSHLSYMNAEVVIPTLLVSLLALLLIIIFVRKEKDLVHKTSDTVSVVFNFLVGLIALPYFTVCSIFIDIVGGNEYISHQIFYFIPAVTVLGIAVSVVLRRKGYSKMSLLSQFIGPALFFVIVIIFSVLGEL